MSNYEIELKAAETKIQSAESKLADTLRILHEEFAQRVAEAVRSSERELAPLRTFVMAMRQPTGFGASISEASDEFRSTARKKENASAPKPGNSELTPRPSTAPARNAKKRAAAPKETNTPVKDGRTARVIILQMLAASPNPVSFIDMDHAIEATGRSRSAGEKAREKMIAQEVVTREGYTLKITASGLAELEGSKELGSSEEAEQKDTVE